MKRTQDNRHIVRALTIAGSDSGGGAGIQADLKTFAAYGVYGTSALTAVTAQNTRGVQGVQYLPEAFVLQQLDSVLADLGADAVKIGMLGSASIIQTVADKLQQESGLPIVLDPVMVAKGGERLIDRDAVTALRQWLFPVADVITPNIPEAEVLSEHSITSWQDCKVVAEKLWRHGARAVIIKGGHASSTWSREGVPELLPDGPLAIDLLYDGKAFTYFATGQVDSRKTHGTGCTFSSAIAASLALGYTLPDAIGSAKHFIFNAIAAAADWDVGAGHGPTDHSVKPLSVQGLQSGKCYLLQGDEWYEAGRNEH